ncbi:radical SAM protein [Geminisphaera colitermitum]|uniref:radical SAM protein n=1 Tax=Geminisphaera colitermitum TaxID=1148786 RepID=UPI000158C98E|nr:radical SAM protein [Geminisphaera colitermitum]
MIHEITESASSSALSPAAVALDFSKHPCFNKSSHHTHGRIHLPVAPRCNLQCNFCNRKFDCMNESRPGVTSAVLTPSQAADYLDDTLKRVPNLAVTGIAGPGDPFANAVETMATLTAVRRRHKDMILCLATNGLGLAPHIDNLAALQVSHVTLTVNAVDPEIGARIYAWIRDGHRPMRGLAAAQLLLDRQIDAIQRLKQHGIVVKINTIIMPGINDQHIEDVAVKMAALDVDIMNCMAFLPVAGAEFENIPPPDGALVAGTRLRAGRHVAQMTHCARCRADAVGLINQPMTAQDHAALVAFSRPDLSKRPYIAVASQEGMLVNQHLGEAARVLVFKQDESTPSGCKFVEVRRAPQPGSGPARWSEFADLLHDCRALLVSAAGPQPRRALEERGVRIVEMEGMIEEGLTAIFKDQPIPASLTRRFTSCGGSGCKGAGTGCG